MAYGGDMEKQEEAFVIKKKKKKKNHLLDLYVSMWMSKVEFFTGNTSNNLLTWLLFCNYPNQIKATIFFICYFVQLFFNTVCGDIDQIVLSLIKISCPKEDGNIVVEVNENSSIRSRVRKKKSIHHNKISYLQILIKDVNF